MSETRTYTFAGFVLVVSQDASGWRASVNGIELDAHFDTAAAAWAAGIRDADSRSRFDSWLHRLTAAA